MPSILSVINIDNISAVVISKVIISTVSVCKSLRSYLLRLAAIRVSVRSLTWLGLVLLAPEAKPEVPENVFPVS
jgi:hypothetical protein